MPRYTPSIHRIGLVASGGFAGATLRYGIDLAVPVSLLATATVNVVGCLVLGVIVFGMDENGLLGEYTALLLTTGLISSFTTYSTFVLDTLLASPETAGVYVLGSYAIGFAAVVVGRRVGIWLATTEGRWF